MTESGITMHFSDGTVVEVATTPEEAEAALAGRPIVFCAEEPEPFVTVEGRLGERHVTDARRARCTKDRAAIATGTDIVVAPRGSARAAAPRERRDRRAAKHSGQDPGDSDPEPGGPWALTWFDRAPLVWRLRALRCRLLELRKEVDR